mmetsp:Transcript_8061/g.23676  ORF Transcript_8061/g.23676 Transcript_8061/m.23676 type:complete len:213 (+) Transcript_8061:410-1048(+)
MPLARCTETWRVRTSFQASLLSTPSQPILAQLCSIGASTSASLHPGPGRCPAQYACAPGPRTCTRAPWALCPIHATSWQPLYPTQRECRYPSLRAIIWTCTLRISCAPRGRRRAGSLSTCGWMWPPAAAPSTAWRAGPNTASTAVNGSKDDPWQCLGPSRRLPCLPREAAGTCSQRGLHGSRDTRLSSIACSLDPLELPRAGCAPAHGCRML